MNNEHKRLISRLETSTDDLLLYLGKLPAEELQRVPAPDEWTLHQVAAHVRDVEVEVFLYRLKRMLKEENPAVESFDGDTWMRERYSAGEPVKKIAAEIRAARKKQIALLKKAKDKDWARTARHSAYGKISVEWMMTHAANHSMEHAAQLGTAYDKEMLKNLNK